MQSGFWCCTLQLKFNQFAETALEPNSIVLVFISFSLSTGSQRNCVWRIISCQFNLNAIYYNVLACNILQQHRPSLNYILSCVHHFKRIIFPYDYPVPPSIHHHRRVRRKSVGNAADINLPCDINHRFKFAIVPSVGTSR